MKVEILFSGVGIKMNKYLDDKYKSSLNSKGKFKHNIFDNSEPVEESLEERVSKSRKIKLKWENIRKEFS